MFEDKKVVIWGTGKYQKDFLYIFEDIHPAYYVTDDEEDLADNTFLAAKLKEEDRWNLLVIVCDFEKERIGDKLEKWGIEHGKSFLYAEEIFPILDGMPELHLNQRKVAFWGAGAELVYFQNNVALENDIYIDGNIAKRGMSINGKKVLYAGDIQDWEEYFIVVTTMRYYPEISEALHKKGL